jgi:hypothetical protein
LREIEFEIRLRLLAHLDARVKKREEVRAVLLSSSLNVVATVGKIFGKGFEVLWRIEHGFFQMIQQTLRQVSISISYKPKVLP